MVQLHELELGDTFDDLLVEVSGYCPVGARQQHIEECLQQLTNTRLHVTAVILGQPFLLASTTARE